MNRTLGLNAEMSYVENGVVNAYSTKFPLRVNADVNFVTFTWSSTASVIYAIIIESEDTNVVPVLRIPSHGSIPHSTQDFIVEYRCAGYRSGQFIVSMYFNFTIQNGDSQSVRLRQEKLCTSRDGRRGLAYMVSGVDGLEQETVDGTEKVFYLIITIASLFLLIIGILLFTYFRKSKKEVPCSTPRTRTPICRLPTSFRSSIRTARSGTSAQPFLTSTPVKDALCSSGSLLGTASNLSSALSSTKENNVVKDKPSNVDVRKALVSLHADRELLQMLPFVDMEGTFGEIRFAIWRQTEDPTNGDVDDEEDAPCTDEPVMCKTLKKNATPVHLEKFLQDALALHKAPPHANLAQVACAASFGRFDDPSSINDLPLICYRHRGFGILKKFLMNCREGDQRKNAHFLRTHELASIALQVGRAMAHLHKFYILHKDIATRNCVIAENGSRLVVQLCDNSLSRDVFPSDYHCIGDNENRPLKWMSPEAIQDRKYTSASDVWSFGVLCWELMSLASVPFPDIDADDMLPALKRGARLPQPANCPDQLYNIMYCCWHEVVRDRPTADQITMALQEFAVTLNQFI
ncbi:unnamed protein product [Auanema sp. JU1783]|nr:unnamed protein product [Auanema sp. JU1783]